MASTRSAWFKLWTNSTTYPRSSRRKEAQTNYMAKARKKTKNAAGKSATLAKPGKAKAQFITRAEARRRAERHVINQMFKGATVRDGAEVRLGI